MSIFRSQPPHLGGNGELKPPWAVHVRWMIKADVPEVLTIEELSFEYPWAKKQFLECLRQRDCVGMVAEVSTSVVGFMIYDLNRDHVHLLSLAVHPDFRRRGVGAAMIDKIVGKLDPQRRHYVQLEVRETNVDAQIFFRAQGFRAEKVLRGFYKNFSEDAYLMRYKVPSQA